MVCGNLHLCSGLNSGIKEGQDINDNNTKEKLLGDTTKEGNHEEKKKRGYLKIHSLSCSNVLNFFHSYELILMSQSFCCNSQYQMMQRVMGGGGCPKNNALYVKVKISHLLYTPRTTILFFPLSI